MSEIGPEKTVANPYLEKEKEQLSIEKENQTLALRLQKAQLRTAVVLGLFIRLDAR